MSTSIKTILWIILAILVILGVWWWFTSQNTSTQNAVSPAAQSNTGMPVVSNAQNQNQAAQAIVSTSTSDASLDQDLANIDAQLGGLASDSAAVDTSLNQSTTAQ